MSITIECLGDPIYYDAENDWLPQNPEDDPDYKPPERPMDCDGKRKVYTLNELPMKIDVFIIKSGGLSIELIYCFWRLTKKTVIEFCEALQSNGTKSLRFDPGRDSEAEISTANGMTTFILIAAGGDEPGEMKFDVPNNCCIEAFTNLIKF